ncbi:MAG TPA: hypothetical protein VEC56_01055 [Candidatus Krumholzibacteria bacterium]|nr:hypothetical protein [Candidatus Krumholzibacteria bacterium]
MKHAADDLIQRSLDGGLSEREQRRLRRILEADPSARAVRDELEAVVDLLGQVEEVAPPPDLRSGILAALSDPPVRERGWLSMLERGGGSWLPRAAALTAAAAIAAVLVVVLVPTYRIPREGEGLAGTLAPAHDAEPSIVRLDLRQEWISGTLRAEATPSGVALELAATTAGSVSANVLYEPTELRFIASSAGEATVQGSGRLEIDPLQSGELTLFFERIGTGESRLVVEFADSGGRRHQRVVLLPGARAEHGE